MYDGSKFNNTPPPGGKAQGPSALAPLETTAKPTAPLDSPPKKRGGALNPTN